MQKRQSRIRLCAAVSLFLLCLTVCGCWDRRELQERSYVMAIAIDTAAAGLKPGQNADTARLETFTQPNGSKRYRLSLQILKISPKGELGTKQKASKTYVVSDTGESFFEIVRDMLGQNSKGYWFEHIQAIIISEAVVKEANLNTLFDFFLRDSEMRSRIRVYITPGEARPILDYRPKSGDPGGMYLSGLSSNYTDDMHILRRSDLGFIQAGLANNNDELIPRLELTDKVLKLGGAAAFRQGQFVGYLDDYAVMGIKLLRGSQKTAVITAVSPENPQNLLVFQSFTHSKKLTPHIDGDSIYFTLDVSLQGYLTEMQGDAAKEFDTLDPTEIRKLEILFANEVRQSILYAWQQLQVLDLAKNHFFYLEKLIKNKDPAAWNRLKDQWYEKFPDVPLYVSANVTIRGIGEHK